MAASYKHIQLRRSSLYELDKANPLLKEGEAAFATDAFILKIGDGKARWKNLPKFISNSTINSKKITIDLPQIESYNSHTVTTRFDGLDTKNEYLVIVQPKTVLPDGIRIDYSYLSNMNEISIQFSYMPNVIDGGSSPAEDLSVASSNVVLYAIAYTVVEYSPAPTTTQPPDPIAGQAFSFGGNQFGQLCLGHNDDKSEPILIEDVQSWKVLSAGHYHTAGINNDYELLTCGYNYYGQLGLGDLDNRNTFTKITSTYATNPQGEQVEYNKSSKFKAVNAGANNTSAIDNAGQLFTTGLNSYGSLGHGDSTNRSNLVLVRNNPSLPLFAYFDYLQGTLASVVDNKYFFEAFANFPSSSKFLLNRHGMHKIILDIPDSGYAFALLNNGIRDKISYSGEYFVSSGTVNGINYPFYSGEIYVDVSGNYGSVSAHSLSSGYAGGEFLFNYSSLDGGWTDVSNGQQHTLGINNGHLYAFGNNTFGQLGTGDRQNKNKPTMIPSDKKVVKVSAGNYHSLFVDASGDAWSFGQNNHGQLGHSNTLDKLSPTKIDLTNYDLDGYKTTILRPYSFTSLRQNDQYYVFDLAYADDNKAYQSRERYLLAFGDYVIYNVPSSHPITLLNNGFSDNIYITGTQSGNQDHPVINTHNNGTYDFYWGDVTISVRGDFDNASIYSVSVDRGETTNHSGYYGGEDLFYYTRSNGKFVDVSAGNNYSVFKMSNGEVYVCGENAYGQLGQGNNTDYYSLTEIEGSWEEINAGPNHLLLVDKKRDIWSCGNNERGQLGLGDNINRSSLTKLRNNYNWTLPSAGGTHSIAALKSYYPQKPQGILARNANDSQRAGDYQIEVSWHQKDALIEGIQYYVVEVSIDGGDWEELPYVKSDNPAQYYIVDAQIYFSRQRSFRVKAVNSFGESEYSDISNSVVAVRLIDPDFCNTLFLTHFDGDVSEQTAEFFEDSSKNGHTYSVNIAVNPIGINGGKFGSALNPHAPDNVRYILSSAFGEGLDGDFTIEFFYNPISVLGTKDILRIEHPLIGGSDTALSIVASDRKIVINGYANEMLESSSILDPGTWSHIAWVRNGLDNALFVNYKRVDFITETVLNEYSPLMTPPTYMYFEAGLIDEVRISDIARYDISLSELDTIQREFGGGNCP